jgi:tetratricopeptide (TPR) repeat protein
MAPILERSRLDPAERLLLADLTRLLTRLTPRGLPPHVRRGLLKHTADFNAASTHDDVLSLGAALAEACPDDLEVQRRVGQVAVGVKSRKSTLILLPALRRAAALEPDPGERLLLQAWVIRCLANAAVHDGGDPDDAREVLSLAKRALPRLQGDPLGWVLASRARAHLYLGDPGAAVRDLDEAVQVSREALFLWWRAEALTALGERPAQSFDDASSYLQRQVSGNLYADAAMVLVYDQGLPQGQTERVREALEVNLRLRPRHAGWHVRLAALQVDAGNWEAARQSLAAAALWFSGGTAAQRLTPKPDLAARCAELGRRLRERSVEAAADLSAFVAELDAQRAQDPNRIEP